MEDTVIDYGIHEAEVKRAAYNENVQELDLARVPLEIAIENIEDASNEEFAMARRDGFGGSDSSVLTEVSPFKTVNQLVKEKASDTLSEEEKAIGSLAAVRKGNDTEPLTIFKADQLLGIEIFKPPHMYRFKDHPYLTMNFDGVTDIEGQYVPVEIKYVTTRGSRSYNRAKAFRTEFIDHSFNAADVSKAQITIEEKAKSYGVPVYYYTQLQQEMMALSAPYGFIAALFEDDWTVRVFRIPRDEYVQNLIIIQGYKAYKRVQELRGNKLSITDDIQEGDYI